MMNDVCDIIWMPYYPLQVSYSILDERNDNDEMEDFVTNTTTTKATMLNMTITDSSSLWWSNHRIPNPVTGEERMECVDDTTSCQSSRPPIPSMIVFDYFDDDDDLSTLIDSYCSESEKFFADADDIECHDATKHIVSRDLQIDDDDWSLATSPNATFELFDDLSVLTFDDGEEVDDDDDDEHCLDPFVVDESLWSDGKHDEAVHDCQLVGFLLTLCDSSTPSHG